MLRLIAACSLLIGLNCFAEDAEEVSKRLEATAKEIPFSEAEAMLKKADSFAQGHDHDPLLVAIRYYEVGDRFKDNEFGRKAIDSSLKYMQQVGEKAKLAEYKPAATDGKAFIISDPVGAAIMLVDANGRQDTGKKTPSLIQLPKGKQTLQLEKDGMKPTLLEITIADGIAKPSAVKLEPVTYSVDVMFDEGWNVFVDGKPAADSAGKLAITPCTIDAPLGKHTLLLAKEGFQDLSQPIEVKEQTTVEFKQKPPKGASMALKARQPSVLGSYPVDKIVVWNTHNAGYRNFGTLEFDLILSMGAKKVHEQKGIKIDWKADEDVSKVIPLAGISFDLLRIEITKYQKEGGGLCEVEIWSGKENVSRNGTAKAVATWENNPRYTPDKLIDGITTSATHGVGYWILPYNSLGWLEISLPKPKK